jgi:flavin reductase (DIM6/NTAB) family NADH-FMN oxidoreductase RutF
MDCREFDSSWFRQVLAQYPTGVCVVTALADTGRPAGMTVGSFTSVSLEPPLVAFLPAKKSRSWQQIRGARCFCVNILAAGQENICRTFAAPAEDRFQSVPFRMSRGGAPIIEGCVAWIECLLEAVHDAGDHEIVVGRVGRLHMETGGLPLLFFQGGYGRFSPLSLATSELDRISQQLHLVDAVRPYMEELAVQLSARCLATVKFEGDLLVAATAGQAQGGAISTFVGLRIPYVPPSSSIFAAWAGDAERLNWLALSDDRETTERALGNVRERGFSLGLASEGQRAFLQRLRTRVRGGGDQPLSEDYRSFSARMAYDPPVLDRQTLSSVRLITAPVLDDLGRVVLAITVFDFARRGDAELMRGILDQVSAMGRVASQAIQRI